jgi:hypothetical protein
MKLAANIVGVLLLLLGALWTLQGSNVIGGSVMSGQSQWLWIGVVAIAIGLGVLYWFNLRKRG